MERKLGLQVFLGLESWERSCLVNGIDFLKDQLFVLEGYS